MLRSVFSGNPNSSSSAIILIYTVNACSCSLTFTMGTLTGYLQNEFLNHCPTEWRCSSEVHLLSRELERTLGYAPRVDVLLERLDGSKRLWIEFEVSRADPVANHAKYATTHLFEPRPCTDSFVAMVSPHVGRGRRNLAANTIALLRGLGLSAFQTSLFPQFSGEDVKRLNHTTVEELKRASLSVETEIERALSVSEPIADSKGLRLHYAGDLLDVVLNAQRWNRQIEDTGMKASWDKRQIRYFVHDPVSGTFAPSKFCAYILLEDHVGGNSAQSGLQVGMNIAHYVTLDTSERRFDGRLARLHLTERLAMRTEDTADHPQLANDFCSWLAKHTQSVSLHRDGPVILRPPEWFL